MGSCERPPERTVLCLSMSDSDKRALMERAVEEGTTAAGLVHVWISNWKDAGDGGDANGNASSR